MAVPSILGVSDATFGTGLAVAWVIVLGGSAYQYTHRTRSRKRFYLTCSVGTLWLGFSLLQISTAFARLPRTGIVILALGVFCTGIVTGVYWWRLRNTGASASAEAEYTE